MGNSERLQCVQALGLDLITVGLVAGGEVVGSIGVTFQGPQHPIEDSLAESTTVGITESTSVADVDVALPGRNAGRDVLVVALALQSLLVRRLAVEKNYLRSGTRYRLILQARIKLASSSCSRRCSWSTDRS